MTRSRTKWLLPLAVIVVILGVATALLATTTRPKPGASVSATSSSKDFAGAVATPPKPAPPLALRNYDGRWIDLRQYAGSAVFVSFLYTHCPDVCPVIASNLRVAQAKLGERAGQMRAVVVSVDPRGDTPSSVASFLDARGLTGRMDYLLGSPQELAGAWSAWSVGSQSDTSNPELVAHSALVYGISASGKVTTLYPANFQPDQIVHDVPRLLGQ